MTTESPSTGNGVRAVVLTLCVSAAALLGFLLFHLTLFPFGVDQAICAVIGDGLLHGEMPYRDRWSMRPPGIYLFYAGGQLLFGKHMAAIRIVEAIAFSSLFAAFAGFSRRHVGSAAPGIVGALLATLIHVQLGYWHTAQSESFGGVVLAWALLLASWRPASKRRQLVAWFSAGALLTLAAMLKPHMGGGFVLCLALLAWARARDLGGWRPALLGRQGILQPIFGFGVGAAAVVAATLLPFLVTGAFADLLWTYRDVVPGYVAISPASQRLVSSLWRAVLDLLWSGSPYLLPGLVLWALLPPLARREREGALFLVAAIVPQILGIALQGKFFGYHSGGLFPLVALWCAWGYYKLWLRIRHRPVWITLLLATAVTVVAVDKPGFWRRCGDRWEAILHPERRLEIEDRLYSHTGHYHVDILETSAWLRSSIGPEDTVFVWGPQAAVYYHSDRRPASRFITNFVLRSRWGERQAQEILRRDLADQRPAAIVVSHDDRPHWVTGHRLDSAESLVRFPWLDDLLKRRYVEADRFGRLQVYLLEDRGAVENRAATSPGLP